jgi:hypothetical protein
MLVNQDWAAPSRQAQNEGSFWGWIEGFNAFYVCSLDGFVAAQGGRLSTNDIVGNILGCRVRIVPDN